MEVKKLFFVLDENKNLIEAYDKEGVLAALEEAIANGSLESLVADSGFISKIKCCVTGNTSQIAFVTMAKYNELEAAGTLVENTAYFITDDTTLSNVDTSLTELTTKINDIINGDTVVPKASALRPTKIFDGSLTGALFGTSCEDKFVLKNGYRYGAIISGEYYEGIAKVTDFGTGQYYAQVTFSKVITNRPLSLTSGNISTTIYTYLIASSTLYEGTSQQLLFHEGAKVTIGIEDATTYTDAEGGVSAVLTKLYEYENILDEL